MDAAVLFGIALPTTYVILWEVIDAINNTPEIGPFSFPQTESECGKHAARWKVRPLSALPVAPTGYCKKGIDSFCPGDQIIH